jgi:large repetitive protein
MQDHMIWSGFSMMAGRNVARAAATALVTLVVLVLGFAGSAMAAAPEIAITEPLTGTSTNTQSPIFSGTSNDVLDSVTLQIYAGASVGGSPIQTDTLLAPVEIGPEQASWEILPESPLGQGQYTAVAEQTNLGSETGTSSSVTFMVDTTPPAVTMNAVASPSQNTEPTLSGDLGVVPGDEASVTVTIHEGGTLSGKTVVSGGASVSGGTWSYKSSHLGDGTYTAQASQRDDAGNLGTSSVTFRVDTTAPGVSINAVASLSNDAEPALSGGAGVAVGDESTVTVIIYQGASAGGTVAVSGGVAVSHGTWSYAASHLADGTYTAQASQSDEAGNLGKSAAVTFTIDTTPPAVTIHPVASPSQTTEPTLTGAAGVAVGDGSIVSVTIYQGASVGGTIAASGNVSRSAGTWTYTAPHLADGTYTARASQTDEVGNVGTSAAVTFTIPPKVTLETPASGEELSFSRPTFSGLAGHAAGDEPSITLSIYEGTSASGTLVDAVPGIKPQGDSWTSDSTALPNGTYTAVAEQLDEAGNKGVSSPVTFTIHTSLSIETAGFVHRSTGLFTGPTPSFDGIAPVGKAVTVKIYSGGSASGSAVAEMGAGVSESGAWAVNSAVSLAGGTYTVQAEQALSPGRLLSAPVSFTVDAEAPRVTLTSPTGGSSTSSSSQILGGSAGTAEGDLPAITTRLYVGATTEGVPLQTISAQASGGSWSATMAALSLGTYTVQAEQSNDVGNTGHSEAVTFTVVPVPSVATQSSPPVASFKWIPSSPNTGEPVTLISTSTDVSAPITGFSWAAAGNGVFTQGESSLTTSFPTPGAHVVQLDVTDASGGSGTVAETIAVSAAPVPLMQPFPVVRMAGSYDSTGAKISLLAVLAPVGARVAITCHGPHCPAKSQAFLATAGTKSKTGTVLVTFRRFERQLRAGVTLAIWVSKHGEIGKFTRFAIHRGKSPSRVDECLNSAATTPIVCPS